MPTSWLKASSRRLAGSNATPPQFGPPASPGKSRVAPLSPSLVKPRRVRTLVVERTGAFDEVRAGLRVLRGRVVGGHQVFRLVADPPQRGRARDRLCRVGLLPGRLASRHRRLLDAEDRFARLPVQDEEVAGFRRHGEGVDRLAAALDVEEHRRRRRVVVPDVVVDGLEVPAVRAGPDVHRDHRVGKQVGAGPVTAVGERNRRSEGQEHEFPLVVDREVERPGVRAQPPAPTVALPGVVADLARLRHGVELPQPLTAHRTESARVADPARRPARCVRAHHHDVLPHQGHRVVGHADLDLAAVAEVRDRRAGRGVERDQPLAGAEDDAGRQVARTAPRPERDAAAGRRSAGHGVPPDLFARGRIERNHRVRGRQVHHAVDHDRRRLGAGGPRPRRLTVPVGGRGRRRQGVAPGLRETGDVGGVQFVERRVARAGRVAPVHRPAAVEQRAIRCRSAADRQGRRPRGCQEPDGSSRLLHRAHCLPVLPQRKRPSPADRHPHCHRPPLPHAVSAAEKVATL